MKIKHFIIIINFVLASMNSCSQNIENGVYTDGRNLICINEDTIVRYDGLFWYKGLYQITNNKLYLINNEFLGKNALITKEECGSDTIEFILTTKTKHYVFGEPDNDTTIYDVKTPLFTIVLGNTVLHAQKAKGIKITKKQLSPDDISHGVWVYDEGSLSGFQDYFNIPIEYGTKYIIKQKYYDFRPKLVTYDYKDSCEIVYNKYKKTLSLNDDFRTDIPHPILKYVSPNCDSCFNELKNRFPKLFE